MPVFVGGIGYAVLSLVVGSEQNLKISFALCTTLGTITVSSLYYFSIWK